MVAVALRGVGRVAAGEGLRLRAGRAIGNVGKPADVLPDLVVPAGRFPGGTTKSMDATKAASLLQAGSRANSEQP